MFRTLNPSDKLDLSEKPMIKSLEIKDDCQLMGVGGFEHIRLIIGRLHEDLNFVICERTSFDALDRFQLGRLKL